MTPKVANRHFYLSMNSNKKGEVWIGLLGQPYAMRAEEIKYGKDGKITFLRLVDSKDGSKRTERITTEKKHVIYISETIEAK
jgi:hypothetical protein